MHVNCSLDCKHDLQQQGTSMLPPLVCNSDVDLFHAGLLAYCRDAYNLKSSNIAKNKSSCTLLHTNKQVHNKVALENLSAH